MSLLRQCLQRISQQFSSSLPKTVRYINPDIIDRFQKIQDSAMDFCKQQSELLNEKNEKNHKIKRMQFLKRLLGYFASIGAAVAYKQISSDQPIMPTVEAQPAKTEEPKLEQESETAEEETHEGTAVPAKKMKRSQTSLSLRDSQVIEYENRLRRYSSPEKIFRYFATVCLRMAHGTQTVMTPDDFLRSIYPGKQQPNKFGLDRFRVVDPNEIEEKLQLQLRENSIFLRLGLKGLITFSDYLFLMTVLLTPRRHFEIAFQIFDFNDDGVLAADEFESLTALARQSATFATTGHDTYRRGISRRLMQYFFGKDLKGKLAIKDFLNFQRDLQNEILTLEFDSKPADERGYISECDFAELLIAYGQYSVKDKEKKLQRIRKYFKHSTRGLSRKDYFDFWELLNNLNDVEMALSFYHLAHASIDKATFHHVARTVVKVHLSDHAVDVAFTLFDDNEDNQLSKKEFFNVMKQRLNRGQEPRPGANFVAIMQALKKCALTRRAYDF